mmetsp:Transcript_45205/g.104790  ORF Transcript_45205/g.104790 Transcript_45205/m.104790 type:complete len:274 (+) Transcript_45205:1950-2771(+)
MSNEVEVLKSLHKVRPRNLEQVCEIDFPKFCALRNGLLHSRLIIRTFLLLITICHSRRASRCIVCLPIFTFLRLKPIAQSIGMATTQQVDLTPYSKLVQSTVHPLLRPHQAAAQTAHWDLQDAAQAAGSLLEEHPVTLCLKENQVEVLFPNLLAQRLQPLNSSMPARERILRSWSCKVGSNCRIATWWCHNSPQNSFNTSGECLQVSMLVTMCGQSKLHALLQVLAETQKGHNCVKIITDSWLMQCTSVGGGCFQRVLQRLHKRVVVIRDELE